MFFFLFEISSISFSITAFYFFFKGSKTLLMKTGKKILMLSKGYEEAKITVIKKDM